VGTRAHFSFRGKRLWTRLLPLCLSVPTIENDIVKMKAGVVQTDSATDVFLSLNSVPHVICFMFYASLLGGWTCHVSGFCWCRGNCVDGAISGYQANPENSSQQNSRSPQFYAGCHSCRNPCQFTWVWDRRGVQLAYLPSGFGSSMAWLYVPGAGSLRLTWPLTH